MKAGDPNGPRQAYKLLKKVEITGGWKLEILTVQDEHKAWISHEIIKVLRLKISDNT